MRIPTLGRRLNAIGRRFARIVPPTAGPVIDGRTRVRRLIEADHELHPLIDGTTIVWPLHQATTEVEPL